MIPWSARTAPTWTFTRTNPAPVAAATARAARASFFRTLTPTGRAVIRRAHAPRLERLRVGQRGLQDGPQAPTPARAPGEREEVDHPEQHLLPPEEVGHSHGDPVRPGPTGRGA